MVNIFQLLDNSVQTETTDFFKKIGEDLKVWFIDNSGWLDVVKVVLFAVFGIVVINLVLRGIEKASQRNRGKRKMSKLAFRFLSNTLRIAMYFLYFSILFMLIGIDLSNIVTMISAAGLAVSFAMQKVASNFASGAILVANKPFEEGDYISCNGVDGTVIDIAMFSTKLLTPDNKTVMVPNAMLADNPVTNFSANPERRVDLQFAVSYDSDVDLVKSTLKGILDEHPLILHDAGYTIRMKEHGESSINFVCRFRVKKDDYWNVYFDVTEAAFLRFKEVGIEIPYNKLDVQITHEK